MLEGLEGLDALKLNFNQGGLHALNFTLFFVMFGVALDIKPAQLKLVFTKPKATLVGLTAQFLVLPAITFLLVWLFNAYLSTGIALGMILVSACPGGNISNFVSSLAKGNAALSVSLTAIATILATFLTPLNFEIWGSMYSNANPLLVPIEIDSFDMFKTLLLLSGLPIILGILFNHRFKNITEKIKKPIKIISIVIFAFYVIIAFSANFEHFIKAIKYVFILVLIHNIIALSIGYYMASLFKVGRKNRRTITIETGIQNSGLALVLIFNPKIFSPELGTGGMAIIAGWWGIWHILSGLLLANRWSKRILPEDN
ncbi:bile acid:sodium symporter family protein [Saccharicrinis aurantiacus]|uniref:bile acid:sodium symporter family protein n=1 Tax=Saccharicrinis aurantiacus TaxID=1849719 RepID=UPI0008388805|nr:bile acid:sodium symporter family protein [Saccharicrinis aurantiacus]